MDEIKVGDKVKVKNLSNIGEVISIDVIEDDDGVDEELDKPIIRKVIFYNVKFPSGAIIPVAYNIEKVG